MKYMSFIYIRDTLDLLDPEDPLDWMDAMEHRLDNSFYNKWGEATNISIQYHDEKGNNAYMIIFRPGKYIKNVWLYTCNNAVKLYWGLGKLLIKTLYFVSILLYYPFRFIISISNDARWVFFPLKWNEFIVIE